MFLMYISREVDLDIFSRFFGGSLFDFLVRVCKVLNFHRRSGR